VYFEGKDYFGSVTDVTEDEGNLLFSVKFDNADAKKWFDILSWEELRHVLVPLEHEANVLDAEISSDLNLNATFLGSDVIPTRTLMLQQPDADAFLEAEKTEFQNMTKHKVWRWATLPKGKKAIPLKFTYKRKRDKNGQVYKHKARVVALGFRQIHGLDYFDTSAPVATTTAFRVLLAVAVARGLDVETMDVDGAFLNSAIKEEVYVLPAPGMTPPDDFAKAHSNERIVLRLQKTLYGLKQSAREWHQLFKSVLLGMGYTTYDGSECAYVLHENGELSILVLHVDDIVHGFSSQTLSARLKDKLRSLWGLSGEGKLDFFLGMQVEYEKGQYARVTQRTYLEGVLRRFNMAEAHPKATPMETSLRISKADAPTVVDEKVKSEFQQALGSILFACVMSRPDLANACAQLGRVMSAPSAEHLIALKRVLRYIAGTLDYGICFTNQRWKTPGEDEAISPLTLTCFCDSDWASNPEDRSSTSGYILMLAGGPVTWKSKKQKSIALSSGEAEYISLGSAAREVLYVRNMLKELGVNEMTDPTRIFSDSTTAISIATTAGVSDRSKHIALRHHFVKSLVAEGAVTLCKIDTNLNPADPFTKALPREPFDRHRSFYMDHGRGRDLRSRLPPTAGVVSTAGTGESADPHRSEARASAGPDRSETRVLAGSDKSESSSVNHGRRWTAAS
jgi:hypothetical protein